jgi:hypothetical protein
MRIEDFVTRAGELILLADIVLRTTRVTEIGSKWVDTEQFTRFRSSCLSFLLNIFGENNPYYTEFLKDVTNAVPNDVQSGKGILTAVQEEIKGGWFLTTKGLISAQIFSDFLEIANYLFSEGYKDPAAVIAGSVLEEHLRQLCQKNKIEIEHDLKGKKVFKKADEMNADLVKANVYNKLDQKQVTAWLDLRNKAAHGKYNGYTKEQVELMIQGIINFMTRVPI